MVPTSPPGVPTPNDLMLVQMLNESQKRLYFATKAPGLGKGGVSKVTRFFGANKGTMYKSQSMKTTSASSGNGSSSMRLCPSGTISSNLAEWYHGIF